MWLFPYNHAVGFGQEAMNIKDKIETLAHVVTMLAIIVGGLWTYNIFIKERNSFPHANIS